ncbi:MAG: helix-turn-helix transcriptional regulator [Williamsia sp.]|nr:helix-turn-helix transcriptional regulator [Williamsia sp.]
MDLIQTDWSLQNIIGNHGNASFRYNEVNSRYRESVFTFNQPGLIEGQFHTFMSPNMEVSLVQMQLKQDMVFQFNDGVKRIGATLLLEGDIDADCICDTRSRPLKHSRHMFTYSQSYQNNYTLHAGNIRLFHVNYKPVFLFEAAGGEELIHDLFGGADPADRCISIPLSFDSKINYQRVAHEIDASRSGNMLQHLFVEAKAMELLSWELQELLLPGKQKATPGKISKADQEKLIAARAYIKEHFTDELSLHKLSLRFQLNEFKLKRGYKQLFSTTVFGHIYQLRMHEAKRLLETGEHTVAETAYMVGYTSPNNFATAFQRMFHHPPSHVLRNITCKLLGV